MSTQESTYKKKYAFTLAEVFLRHSDGQRRVAFTLAEVLITLGIIGVVAAMTMPTLIQKQNEKATVTALKKVYSTMSQAYQFAVAEHGPIENWGFLGSADVDINNEEDEETYQNSSEAYMNIFAPYLKIVKRCKANDSNCPLPAYTHLDGSQYPDKIKNKAIMADGMIVSFEVFSSDCSRNVGEAGNGKQFENTCGSIFVDINGYKAPNRLGHDYFSFYITKYGIIPRGTSAQTGNYSFEATCKDAKTQYGYSCSGWVIYNENMDYLHCNDLSWDGKKKCK